MSGTTETKPEVFLREFREACESLRQWAKYPEHLATVSTLVGLPTAVVASIVATMASHTRIQPERVFEGLLRFSLRMAFDSFAACAEDLDTGLAALGLERPVAELVELTQVGRGWEETEKVVARAQLSALDGAVALLDRLQEILDRAIEQNGHARESDHGDA
jgi:hypothetical protein